MVVLITLPVILQTVIIVTMMSIKLHQPTAYYKLFVTNMTTNMTG